jgi:hypothetical protein
MGDTVRALWPMKALIGVYSRESLDPNNCIGVGQVQQGDQDKQHLVLRQVHISSDSKFQIGFIESALQLKACEPDSAGHKNGDAMCYQR